MHGKSVLKKTDIIELGKIKEVELVGKKIQQLITEKRNQTVEKAIDSKEKVLNILKPYLSSPEDCDGLISEIKKIKKLILSQMG